MVLPSSSSVKEYFRSFRDGNSPRPLACSETFNLPRPGALDVDNTPHHATLYGKGERDVKRRLRFSRAICTVWKSGVRRVAVGCGFEGKSDGWDSRRGGRDSLSWRGLETSSSNDTSFHPQRPKSTPFHPAVRRRTDVSKQCGGPAGARLPRRRKYHHASTRVGHERGLGASTVIRIPPQSIHPDPTCPSRAGDFLAGKTAAITGGTTGIGRAIALEYLRQGCNVAINHLGLERDEVHKHSLLEEAATIRAERVEGETTSRAGELLEVVGDVTKSETGTILVEKAVEKWGKLDVFVANAGVFKAAEFLTLDHKLFDQTVRVNLNGAFYTCRTAARQMVKQGHGGSIIGISSISALVGGGLQTHYTPTKAGVLSLMQSMAIAMGKHNIRCNAVLPGTIRTQLADEDMRNEVKVKYLESRIPMGRIGETTDIAGPAVFFACEQLSPYCNGSQLLSDGGINLSMGDEASTPTRRARNRQSRGRGLRKTTGCIICRKRHVKCDEEKPSCRRCVKINETCNYGAGSAGNIPRTESVPQTLIYDPPRDQTIPRWQGPPDQSVQFAQPFSNSGADIPSEGNAVNSLTNANIQNDYSIKLQSTVPAETLNQQVVSPEQLSNYAQTPYSIGSNDSLIQRSSSYQPTFNVAIAKWFDMLVGDAAFDNGMPGFDLNIENLNSLENPLDQDGNRLPSLRRTSNFDLNGQQCLSPASSSPQLLERNPPTLDVATEKQKWQASDTIELLAHENFIFKNFVQRISLWIDLFDPTQSFSTFVPHLAMRNTGLMKAILALSTRHLSQNPCIAGEQSHDRNDALQYYNETLHYISKAMQYDTYKTGLELLATALIVSTYEMLDGSGKDWERHLQGVFWIQRSQVIHGDSKGLKQAVWWAWLCQDVWAAFREKRKTFTFWKPQRTYDVLNPYELAARSVYLMAQVVSYCSRDENDDSVIDITSRIEKADRLTDMLDEWQRHLTTEFTPLPSYSYVSVDPFQPIWIHPPAFGEQAPLYLPILLTQFPGVALQLHHSARLLLLLNKPSRGGFGSYLEQGRRIASLVANICGIAMTLTDNASSVMSSQCLYIAGMCIQDSRQRQAVLGMLDSCRQRIGWPIKSLGEELQAFWDAPENG
ncbi:hypothetical protein G7Y89_g14800 [Cudoniella acicularis]|uniref:Zn(2)-C6 fungal-type domain-containing protein n=1 Tax=Cudoniella acicularis TaxID=354080 RepID=A0A8H4VQE3_9HELO|nr:hypothetical protein G7Y89_g14800 [Cudoniella acicularis]